MSLVGRVLSADASMHDGEVVSHFWVAGPPFFSSTLLVASGAGTEVSGAVDVTCELFDVDGVLVQTLSVQFPEREVGIIELEPFLAHLKMQAGIPQGHLVVRSKTGTRHFMRQQVGEHVDLVKSPVPVKSREMTFIPLLLGAQREHLVTLLNVGDEVGQVVVRLLYSTRSPEWTVHLPPRGSRVISLEHELLASFDDSSWQKGVVQGYLRLSPRVQTEVVCQMVERIPGEREDAETFRSMTSW
jgi:hypothetical protein